MEIFILIVIATLLNIAILTIGPKLSVIDLFFSIVLICQGIEIYFLKRRIDILEERSQHD